MKEYKKYLTITSLVLLVFCLHVMSFYIKKISESKNLKHDASIEETDRVREYVALPYSDSTLNHSKNKEEMFNEPLESIEPLAALTDEDLSNILYILENYSTKQEWVSKEVHEQILETTGIIHIASLKIRYDDYNGYYEWMNKTTDITYVVTLNESYNDYYNDTETFCKDFIVEEITWYGTNTINKKACQSSDGIWMIKGQMDAEGQQADNHSPPPHFDSQNEESIGYSQNGQNGNERFPAGGALLGQAIGNNTESTMLGAEIGGVLGYVIGNEMDKSDLQMLNNVYESTPSGQTKRWVNRDQGNQYQVTPQPAYIGPNNQQCRKAEIMAVIDDRTERTYSTACRNMNGQWHLQQNRLILQTVPL